MSPPKGGPGGERGAGSPPVGGPGGPAPPERGVPGGRPPGQHSLYRAGPLLILIEVVCLAPPIPSQRTETTTPGWYLAVMPVSESGVVTAWPSTERITSPAARPVVVGGRAAQHAEDQRAAAAGAMLAGTLSCWLLFWQATAWRPPGDGPAA